MAIPWLIGAAVVATAAYIASSDSEEEERAERRARARELEAEAEAKKRRARETEQRRAAEQEKQQLEQYAADQLEILLVKYRLATSLNSDNKLSDDAIDNAKTCRTTLKSAFERSSANQSLSEEIASCEDEIKKLDEFYSQLGAQPSGV